VDGGVDHGADHRLGDEEDGTVQFQVGVVVRAVIVKEGPHHHELAPLKGGNRPRLAGLARLVVVVVVMQAM